MGKMIVRNSKTDRAVREWLEREGVQWSHVQAYTVERRGDGTSIIKLELWYNDTPGDPEIEE